MMNEFDFWNNIKAQIDVIKEQTILEFLQHDEQYEKAKEEQAQAETVYMKLKLTEKQKNIIDNLLFWTDYSNSEYSTLSYLAGLKDSQRILKYFGTNDLLKDTFKTNMEQKKDILESLYCGEIYPNEQMKESLELQNYWNEMLKEERKFVDTLTPLQEIFFKKILEMRMESLSMYTKESFIYGFQIGSKIVISIYSD